MRVLSWVQTRIHGPHCSGKKPEFQYGSAPPVDSSSSGGPRRDVDELHEGWMLSIGTLGVRQGRRDELERMQEELTLPVTAKAVATTMAEEDEEYRRRHLTPIGESFWKLVRSVLSGFLPKLSFREATPELRPTEIPWPVHHDDMPAEDLVMSEATINSYRTAHLPWRGNAIEAEQGSKWIRTDSEYIVLEI